MIDRAQPLQLIPPITHSDSNYHRCFGFSCRGMRLCEKSWNTYLGIVNAHVRIWGVTPNRASKAEPSDENIFLALQMVIPGTNLKADHHVINTERHLIFQPYQYAQDSTQDSTHYHKNHVGVPEVTITVALQQQHGYLVCMCWVFLRAGSSCGTDSGYVKNDATHNSPYPLMAKGHVCQNVSTSEPRLLSRARSLCSTMCWIMLGVD